jgi:hypothetical protein
MPRISQISKWILWKSKRISKIFYLVSGFDFFLTCDNSQHSDKYISYSININYPFRNIFYTYLTNLLIHGIHLRVKL